MELRHLAILCGSCRRAKRHARGSEASRIAADLKPPNPRLKIRPLQPAPPPLVLGVAYRKKPHSTVTDSFIDAAERAKED